MGEKRKAYRLLVGKPEGWRPLGRPRHRSMDNIKMDLVEVGWGDADCIGTGGELSEFGIEPSGSIKYYDTIEYPDN
jgi:hypothetical protein